MSPAPASGPGFDHEVERGFGGAPDLGEPGVLLLTACDEVRQAIRPEWEAELRKRTGRDLRWNEESPLLIDAIAAQAVAP